jgi:hypothetical protein
MQIDWRSKWGILAAGGVVAFLALTLAYMMAVPGSTPSSAHQAETTPSRDEELVQAQDILAKATDSGTCWTALQQLNVYLEHHADRRAEPLTEQQRRLLQDRKGFGLGKEEMAEVENPNFTLLDAQHLDLCFLLRDAVRSLDLEGLSQPEQAAVAFAWVMRQVRPVEDDTDLVPPQFVLHRGWGNTGERVLVLVTLLEQLGMSGCILGAVDAQTGNPRGWGCGALVTLPGGKKEVLVFDPGHGLPLPGPAGAGRPELTRAFQLALPVPVPKPRQLATLAELRRHPELLGQLAVDGKYPSGLSAEDVRGAQLFPVTLLSSLAPRMKGLQEELASSQGGAVVSIDPVRLLDDWKAAATGQGEPAPAVLVWRYAVAAQRRFWPPEEGGSDKTQQARKRLKVVRWGALPRQILTLEGEPGDRLRLHYIRPFADFYLAPGRPRDLVVRGRFDDATHELVQARDELREQRNQEDPSAENLDRRLNAWCAQVIEAQAGVLRAEGKGPRGGGRDPSAAADVQAARARLDQVWKAGEEFLSPLIASRAALAQAADVTFELALCKHEQAERLQAVVDRARRAGRPVPSEDAEAAVEGWNNAVSWWQSYVSEAATEPLPQKVNTGLAEPPPAVRATAHALARLLEARAQVALGKEDAAVRLLDSPPADFPEAEQLARLYLLRQLREAKHADDRPNRIGH